MQKLGIQGDRMYYWLGVEEAEDISNNKNCLRII